MARRVLIIGGTGLIGPWVVAGLRELAPSVDVLVFNRSGRAPEGALALAGDRRDPAALADAIADARPDVLIDMIAFTEASTQATVAALRGWAGEARVVVVSSAEVYESFSRLNGLVGGSPEAGPITEASPLRVGEGTQGSSYDKLAVERAYAAAFRDVAALRLPAVYGWPDQSRIARYADAMLDGAEEVPLDPSLARWRFARVLNRNAGWAVALAALKQGQGFQAWNVAEPDSPTEAEWAARIGTALGWTGRIVEREGASPPGPEQDFALSDARIRAELGYRERHDPDKGLAESLRLYAETRGRR